MSNGRLASDNRAQSIKHDDLRREEYNTFKTNEHDQYTNVNNTNFNEVASALDMMIDTKPQNLMMDFSQKDQSASDIS